MPARPFTFELLRIRGQNKGPVISPPNLQVFRGSDFWLFAGFWGHKAFSRAAVILLSVHKHFGPSTYCYCFFPTKGLRKKSVKSRLTHSNFRRIFRLPG